MKRPGRSGPRATQKPRGSEFQPEWLQPSTSKTPSRGMSAQPSQSKLRRKRTSMTVGAPQRLILRQILPRHTCTGASTANPHEQQQPASKNWALQDSNNPRKHGRIRDFSGGRRRMRRTARRGDGQRPPATPTDRSMAGPAARSPTRHPGDGGSGQAISTVGICRPCGAQTVATSSGTSSRPFGWGQRAAMSG